MPESQDRLFVPMSKGMFRLLEYGKTWEVRRLGRQWTRNTIVEGRRVECRLGYGLAYKAKWGTITRVIEAESIPDLYKKVKWRKVFPLAGSLDTARNLMGMEFFSMAFGVTREPIDLIAFGIRFDPRS